MRLRGRLLAVAVIMALLSGCAGSGSKSAPAPAGTTQAPAAKPQGDTTGVTDTAIKLGSITDLTGPTAAIQVPYLSAIQTYLKWVNDKGGVNGRKLELVSEDDRYTVPGAVAAFKKLTTQDKIFAMLGQGGSSQSSALSEDIKDLKLPVFGPMQTTKEQLANPFIFNLLSSYQDQASVLVKYIVDDLKKQGKDKPVIATLTQDVESGYEWATFLSTALAKQNLKLAKHVLMASSATETTAQTQQLIELKPDAVVILGNAGNTTVFLKDANRYGLKVPIYSAFSGFSATVYQGAGPEASANFRGVHSYNPPQLDTPGLKEMREIGQKYGQDKYLSVQQYVQGWTTARVFVAALNKAGKDLTREGLIKAIQSMNSYDTEGLSAPVSFSATNNNGLQAVRIFGYDFDKKQIVPIGDWIKA